MRPFELVNASSVESALAELSGGAVARAGGIDLIDLQKEQLLTPRRLVNLASIAGLTSLSDDPQKGLTVGPLVSLATLAEHAAVRKRYGALAQAAEGAATPQLRNRATVAGNLCQRPRCWYFRQKSFHCLKKGGPVCFAQQGDNRYHAIFDNARCAIVHPSALALPLLALGATVELQGAQGKRTIPLTDFFVAPEIDVRQENVLGPSSTGAKELIIALHLPAPAVGSASAYRKQKEKQSHDWPLAEAAVALTISGGICKAAHIVLGAVAPTPRRAKEAEALLVGKRIDDKLAQSAAQAALAGAQPLAGNKWRVAIARVVLEETILDAARGAREAAKAGGEK